MSDHYPRPDLKTSEEIAAYEEACQVRFDRLQRFFVRGGFVRRDAFLPIQHRPRFILGVSVIAGALLLALGLFATLLTTLSAKESPEASEMALIGCAIVAMLLLPAIALFPFKKWSGTATLPAQMQRGRFSMYLPPVMAPLVVFPVLFSTIHRFPVRYGALVAPAVLVLLVVVFGSMALLALWRTPKFVDPGFEDQWIDEHFGKGRSG